MFQMVNDDSYVLTVLSTLMNRVVYGDVTVHTCLFFRRGVQLSTEVLACPSQQVLCALFGPEGVTVCCGGSPRLM